MGASTTTAESHSSFNRRTNRTEHVVEMQRMAKVKTVLAVVAIVVVMIAVGVTVGSTVYFSQLGTNFELSASETPTSLVTAKSNTPYYTVVTADLNASDGCNTDVDALALMRIDESSKLVTIISIPVNLSVTLSDAKAHEIKDAVSVGGYTELVQAVADFSGVSIAHFVKTDEKGIRALADDMGGVKVNLSEEVDDPNAGSIYIPTGEQTLSGDALMVFLRASNFKQGTATMEANQSLFLAMSLSYLAGSDNAAKRLEDVSGCFQTDMKSKDLSDALTALNGFKAGNAYRQSVPGYYESEEGNSSYISYSKKWTQMMSQTDAGQNPSLEERNTISDIYPAAYTVTVRNGSGITGGATTIANMLSGVGFNVEETGNADSYVYNETLVVYSGEANKAAAEAAVDVLGVGRATESGLYYTYDTDLLVILGSDWKPIN